MGEWRAPKNVKRISQTRDEAAKGHKFTGEKGKIEHHLMPDSIFLRVGKTKQSHVPWSFQLRSLSENVIRSFQFSLSTLRYYKHIYV